MLFVYCLCTGLTTSACAIVTPPRATPASASATPARATRSRATPDRVSVTPARATPSRATPVCATLDRTTCYSCPF